jgi:ribosomal protein L34
MKKTPVVQKKNTKIKKQGFLYRSESILKSRRQKGRKNLINK